MLVSYKWLKELVDVDVTTAELAEKMSTTGIEVEGVETPAEGLSKLVVGHVLSCEDVPETHLHLCQVDTGDAEGPRQIVCGAPNVTAGIKVIVAIPGARIADNYKIKKGKIRGMESLGMICSLAELGLPDSIIPKEFADGIQILPEDAVPGDSIFPYHDVLAFLPSSVTSCFCVFIYLSNSIIPVETSFIAFLIKYSFITSGSKYGM